MYTVLHLSYDYTEKADGAITTAISNLVAESRKIAIVKVISLDRVSKLTDEIIKALSSEHVRIKSFGLPYGLFLLSNLKRAYKAIMKADSERLVNLKAVDIIHAHKLTFEGYIGYLLACKFDIPLFVSLRQTDFMVLKFRPDLHPLIKKILKRSSRIFFILPYMVNTIESTLGSRFFEECVKHKLTFLPNIVDRKVKELDTVPQKGILLTVARMTKQSVKRKNIKNLFKGICLYPNNDLTLNIIGDGEFFRVVKGWAARYNILNKVNFLGSIENSKIDQHYKEAQGFVLPSYSETFGLVYAESLLNGTPILYSKTKGFDGLFDNIGVAVNPGSPTSIAFGIQDLLENNALYRRSIINLQKNNSFHIFSADYSRETYQKCLENISESEKLLES